MLPTRPSIESTSSADSVGWVSRLSGAFGASGLTRSDSLTSILTSCVRLYLGFWAQALVVTPDRASTPKIASFILNILRSLLSGGLQLRSLLARRFGH